MRKEEQAASGPRSANDPVRQIALAEEPCPRCHLYFTLSYRENGQLVMARCLSCDLRWPRPDVV